MVLYKSIIIVQCAKVKHEYLQSCAYICLSLSSPSSSADISVLSLTIEILALTSLIPASKNFTVKSQLYIASIDQYQVVTSATKLISSVLFAKPSCHNGT